MKQPNFIFFITDQQRYDHVGYFGNKVLQTPVLDALAQEGTWFSKFYVGSPTCMSSRATFMTGRMPSLNGVRFNGIPLNLDAVTFVDLLRASGYSTALIGKSHLQGMLEAKSMVPNPSFEEGLTEPPEELSEALRTHHKPEAYTAEMQEVWRRYSNQAERISTPYYGFDHIEFCLGHSDLVAGHYNNWLQEKAGEAVDRGIANARQISDVDAPQVYEPQLTEALYPTKYIEERTIEFIEEHAASDTDQPFFIQCSFPDPHHPFTPPGKYYSMYSPDEVELPQSFYSPNKDATPPMRLLWDEYESGEKPTRWTFPFVTGEAEARDITAKTYGQISMIDDAMGNVLEALERTGLKENTVIVFLSDHGDYLGDHGLMLKGPMHYQSVIRVPFVWHDPDPAYRSGRQDGITSILDIATTVLHRAGLRPYNGIQGVDLRGALSGDESCDDRSIIIESTTQYPFLGFDDIVSVTSLIDERWRLSIWQGVDWGELYDVSADPGEINNLWLHEDYSEVKQTLLHRLIQKMQDHGESSPYPQSVS